MARRGHKCRCCFRVPQGVTVTISASDYQCGFTRRDEIIEFGFVGDRITQREFFFPGSRYAGTFQLGDVQSIPGLFRYIYPQCLAAEPQCGFLEMFFDSQSQQALFTAQLPGVFDNTVPQFFSGLDFRRKCGDVQATFPRMCFTKQNVVVIPEPGNLSQEIVNAGNCVNRDDETFPYGFEIGGRSLPGVLENAIEDTSAVGYFARCLQTPSSVQVPTIGTIQFIGPKESIGNPQNTAIEGPFELGNPIATLTNASFQYD